MSKPHRPVELLGDRWKKFEKVLKSCTEEFTEENVHDLRVSIRRLLSTVRAFEVSIPDPKVRRAAKALKGVFDRFGELRDAQVQLAYLEGMEGGFPGLEGFVAFLEYEESRFREESEKSLSGADFTAIREGIECLRRKRKEFRIELAVWEAERLFLKVRAFRDVIDSKAPKLLHRMRISFKRYRFTVEFLADLLGTSLGRDDRLVKRILHFHDALGGIQDLEVLRGKMERYESASGGIAAPLAEIVKRRDVAIDAFLAESEGLFRIGRKVNGILREAAIRYVAAGKRAK